MVVKFLARAAVTGLLLSIGAPVHGAAQEAAVTDSSFLQMAGSIGLLQAKLAKMAQSKAGSPAVREFGKKMEADYAQLNEELAAGAKQAAYPAPVVIRQHKQVYDKFDKSGGSSFDKKYMAQVVADQNAAVRLFQHEAEHGRIASVKELAAKLLPTLEQHVSLATQTATSVGAEVTSAADGDRQGS